MYLALFFNPFFESGVIPSGDEDEALRDVLARTDPVWPGTTVRIADRTQSGFVAERAWLGMVEARVPVVREPNGGLVVSHEADLGIGFAVKRLIGLVLPAGMPAVLLLARTRPSSIPREPSRLIRGITLLTIVMVGGGLLLLVLRFIGGLGTF